MYDLTAQVTSSLLPFSGVTIEALGEDEITLDSVLHGRFTIGRTGLAWLACGPHLEVVHSVTGERLSAYRFSGGGEHPPTVLAARDFSWLKRSGLLVGLEETEGSVLCLYDLGLSRVVKAVLIPGRITAIEPLVSYGGASTSTQHLHQSLRWFFGIAAVVTDLGHVLLVDLCLDDLSCSQTELEASDLQVVTKSPAEIPRLREVSTREGRHLCLQLNAPTGVGASALQYLARTNQLAVGFSDGYLQLWNMKALKKEYQSQLEGGRVPVYAFTFQEPENDPRNCCYLWAVQSSQDLDGDVVSLHLLQLAFSERKGLSSGKILYEGLEYCEERYSQALSGTAFPLRVQATNTRLLNCLTIEKFRAHPDRDDSMNEVASPDTSVSIFSWQVRAYGQGTPTTYIGIFDINRWYHAQMPDSLRAGESLQNCPYLAVWSLDSAVQMVSQHVLLDVVVHERSLSRGLPYTCPPPEQYFNPTTYNFDATCLFNSGIVHLTCSGYQKETLSFLKKAAPCSSDIISASFSHCLMSGLISSRLADTQPSSLSQEEQLDAILSTAVETSSLGLITGCIKQWTAEEQPGSALNLRYILDWAWNKVVQTKKELDNICAPLFDCSSNFTDPQTLQLLQRSQRLLSNLSAIFHCLLSEAQELTQKGLAGLMNKNMVSNLISRYAQVVLWFCRTGLLPEGSDEDVLQIPRPFYTHSVISSYYTIRREELTRLAKGKWSPDCLMIDGLIGQCGEYLTNLWKRDEGGTGQYPPPTLHALLDIYLLENIDEGTKHAIVIYLLLDVMYSFPNKDGASVESFPTAFAIPIGLVKLVQGLWLLDHHDHQSSFELLLHPAASQCHFEWQHERVLHALMCQSQQSVALRYFHVTKPPISSTSQAKLCLSVLLHNRCLLEAWCLLRQHSNHLNMSELLGFMYESCQELGLMKELLKLPLGLNEQEGLGKFLQGTGGFQNRELLMVHYLQQANYIPALQLNHGLKMNLVNERDPKLKERTITRNSIMDQYGKILPRVQRKLAMERAKPYQHPSTVRREVSRPLPLSTITKCSNNEKVISRAGFINNVLTKIEEVWLGKGATPQSSPAKSPRAADVQIPSPKSSTLAFSEPFLGTPITMTSRRKSRLMDLVVQPSYQSPRQPFLSPPRPSSSWASPKSTSKAPEFSLLQTPQVVKRARALAASGPPVFSGFTPQSILRSSLRPTPVATPSASPGRSITPPLSRKGSRITFIEEAESPEPEKGIAWTNGVAAESEISLLTRGAVLSKAARKTWSLQPAEEENGEEDVDEEEEEEEEEEPPHVKFLPPEGGIPSPQLRCSESESSVHEVTTETKPAEATQACPSPSFNISQQSVPSADTTLEYFDAPLSSEDLEEDAEMEKDDVVTVNIKPLAEQVEQEEIILVATEQTVHQTSQDNRVEEDDEAREDKTLEDVIAVALGQETKNAEEQEDVATLDQDEVSIHPQDGEEVLENLEFVSALESQTVPVNEDQEIMSETTEPPELIEHPVPSDSTETTNKPLEDLQQSSDLTEFVQQHLFGDDPMSPLTRSGIHDASQTEASSNSESLVEDKGEPAASEAPPALTTQKSSASVSSSEAAGSDSHSVVSVNDSEELSSPASDEEDEEEEEKEEEAEEEEEEDSDQDEEEEDSGSEVEIIEEVQGNGRLPPLEPTSVFVEPANTHFLPALSEQEAAEFSVIPPSEMKMVDEDMDSEVVMVRLGRDDSEMDQDDVEQGSSYMELKPSTTLLVPFELMEGHHDLTDVQMDLPGLQQDCVVEDPPLEAESNFSLMLDLDMDGNKDEDTELPIENDLLSLDPVSLSQAVNTCEEISTCSQVILVRTDNQVAPQEDDKKEMELDGNDVDGLTDSELVEFPNDVETGPQHETEDAPEQDTVELELLAEENEAITVSVSGAASIQELTADVNDTESEKKAENWEAVEEAAEIPETVDEKDDGERLEILVTTDDAELEQRTETAAALDEADFLEKTVDHKDSMEKTNVQETVDNTESEEMTETPDSAKDEEDVDKADVQGADNETDSAVQTDEVEESDKTSTTEEQKGTEENGPVDIFAVILPSTEMKPPEEEEEEEEQPVHKVSAKAEYNNSDKTETKTVIEKTKTDLDVEPDMLVLSSGEESVPEAPFSQKTKPPSTPTRRMTTRGRKTVAFISPSPEESDDSAPQEDGGVEEAEADCLVPASPSRTPRKSRQGKETKVKPSTLQRSTRKAYPDPPLEEAEVAQVNNVTRTTATSKAASPARRSQRTTPARASQRPGSGSEELTSDGDVREQELTKVRASRRNTSKTPTPAKGRPQPISTPRRSSRRIFGPDEPPAVLEVNSGGDADMQPPAKRSSRQAKAERAKVLPDLFEMEEEKTQLHLSPGRTTRQSNRLRLSVYPQSITKMRRESENSKGSEDLLKPRLNKTTDQTCSRCPNRSKLWDHPEEDLPLLDSPLEVDFETPVADALIKRLQNEEEKQEVITKSVRSSRRKTKSSVEQPIIPEPAEDDSSPGEHSFIYSPSRRQTRSHRAESPGLSEEPLAPITRSRRVRDAPQEENASEEDHAEVEKTSVSKTRKTGKRPAKSKAFVEPVPIAEVDPISPLPSPANPLPRAQKKVKEAEVAASSRNLRRKRGMETIFAKPVTRRKKL